MDAKGALANVFDVGTLEFEPTEVAPNLSAMAMNTEDSLREYLRLFVRIPLLGRIGPLASTFDFVADAAPGVKEILGVGKLCWEVRERNYDLIVVDAEASGHIVSQIGAPRVIADLVQVGLVRDQTEWMLDILDDPMRTGVAVVTTPEEMPVTETIELLSRLRAKTGAHASAVIANRVLPAMFNRREQAIVDRLDEAMPVLVDAVGAGVGTVLEAASDRSAALHGRGPPRSAARLDERQRRGDRRLAHHHRAGVVRAGVRSPGGLARRRRTHRRTRPRLRRRLGRGFLVSDLDNLLASREMILVAGSGGVGKTTIAAALGIAAASRQKCRVLVLTVDPARRLATALGLEEFGNAPVRIEPGAFSDAGVKVRGEVWVAMLDTKAGWDELIMRHVPDDEIRDAVLANPLYENITSRFVHSHEYLAMEQLHDLHARGDFDLVIVDTPPSRNALSILDAPGRMVEFFGSRLLRWLTVPYRSRLFTMASKPFYQVADRVLGSRFLQDIADFFVLFQAMEPGFVRRAREVEALLVDPRTAFIVVTTLETAPSHEAHFLARSLLERQMCLGAIVANRVLPEELAGSAAADSAAALLDQAAGPLAETVAELLDAPVGQVRSVLTQIASRFDDVALVAARESDRRRNSPRWHQR